MSEGHKDRPIPFRMLEQLFKTSYLSQRISQYHFTQLVLQNQFKFVSPSLARQRSKYVNGHILYGLSRRQNVYKRSMLTQLHAFLTTFNADSYGNKNFYCHRWPIKSLCEIENIWVPPVLPAYLGQWAVLRIRERRAARTTILLVYLVGLRE